MLRWCQNATDIKYICVNNNKVLGYRKYRFNSVFHGLFARISLFLSVFLPELEFPGFCQNFPDFIRFSWIWVSRAFLWFTRISLIVSLCFFSCVWVSRVLSEFPLLYLSFPEFEFPWFGQNFPDFICFSWVWVSRAFLWFTRISQILSVFSGFSSGLPEFPWFCLFS